MTVQYVVDGMTNQQHLVYPGKCIPSRNIKIRIMIRIGERTKAKDDPLVCEEVNQLLGERRLIFF